MKDNFQIVSYKPSLKKYFILLNEEWLEKYFYVEKYDKELLENCENEIIKKGGQIYFGLLGTNVIATYSLLPPKNNCVELGKMAVKSDFQGKGYGQKLLKHCIKIARKNNFNKIILFSNKKLENSIYLYIKYGFIEVKNINSPYKRGDIKMCLKL